MSKFSDEVPINIENDLQINESVAGKEHSSEAKTKVSIVIFVNGSKMNDLSLNLFNCEEIANIVPCR